MNTEGESRTEWREIEKGPEGLDAVLPVSVSKCQTAPEAEFTHGLFSEVCHTFPIFLHNPI